MSSQDIFDDIVAKWSNAAETAGKEIVGLAANSVKGLIEDAKSDGEAQLNSTRTNIIEWTSKLAEGELKEAEYRQLLKSKASLLKFQTLTAAGIAQARIELFRKALIDLITKTALDAIS